MEEKIFYVKSDTSGELQQVKVSDVNLLATKAVALRAVPAVTEALGYAEALSAYYCDNDDDLKASYQKVMSGINGNLFLNATITLCLFENAFRNNGISEEDIESYSKVIADYQRQLNFNAQQYGEIESVMKTK